MIIFLQFFPIKTKARVAELVDAQDLKSCDFGHAGSIPAPGTKINQALQPDFLYKAREKKIYFLFRARVKNTLVFFMSGERASCFAHIGIRMPKR